MAPIPVYFAAARLGEDPGEMKDALVQSLVRTVDPGFLMGDNGRLIENDFYGCPRFNGEIKRPFSLSFSYSGQVLWAAVARTEALGIDVETPEHFSPPYPYDRAFRRGDFQMVSAVCRGREDAAALLWSCKEAAVKCRGTGFHCIDPRDVRVLSCRQVGCGRFRISVTAPDELCVMVRREGRLWFAVAV